VPNNGIDVIDSAIDGFNGIDHLNDCSLSGFGVIPLNSKVGIPLLVIKKYLSSHSTFKYGSSYDEFCLFATNFKKLSACLHLLFEGKLLLLELIIDCPEFFDKVFFVGLFDDCTDFCIKDLELFILRDDVLPDVFFRGMFALFWIAVELM
jgi:hypothetical protein